MVKKHFII